MPNNTIVDDKEFQSLMKQVTKLSSRQPQESITRRLFHVVLRASKLTPKSDKLGIMTLFQVSKTVTLRKIGRKAGRNFKRTGRKNVFGANNIYKILNAKLTAQRKPGLKRATALAQARKEISRRLSSIGTLKAGFTRGLKQLALAGGLSFRTRERKRVQKQSKAIIPPTKREKFTVAFQYDLVGRTAAGNSTGVPVLVQQAISKSVNIEKVQMAQRIGKEFSKNIKKLSKGFKMVGL